MHQARRTPAFKSGAKRNLWTPAGLISIALNLRVIGVLAKPRCTRSYGNVFQHPSCFGNVRARIASTGPIAPFVISSMIRLMM